MKVPETTAVSTREGDLYVCEYGDPSGRPLVILHGTPGSRFQRYFDESAYARAGFRAILFDRPGYGRAPRRRGRSIMDGARSVVALLDALGLERIAVLGVSGGGAYAFATAAAAPARVAICGALVPAAPENADFDRLAGMSEDQRAEAAAFDDGEEAFAAFHDARSRELLSLVAQGKLPFVVPPPVQLVAMQWIPEAWAQGSAGVVDDSLATLHGWGFDLDTIRVPTHLWYGDEDDMCPPSHAAWLARHIPGAQLHAFHGGHLGFMPTFGTILTQLREAWPA